MIRPQIVKKGNWVSTFHNWTSGEQGERTLIEAFNGTLHDRPEPSATLDSRRFPTQIRRDLKNSPSNRPKVPLELALESLLQPSQPVSSADPLRFRPHVVSQ